MVSSNAQTIKQYLAELPEDRREALMAVRKVVRANLPKGYQEGMQYGLIGYFIPLSRYPKTYDGKPLGVIALGAQRRHMEIYLMWVYGNPDLETWFRGAFAKSGKKLNMGKSCVRFNKLADLPLDVIGDAVSRVSVDDVIRSYESAQAGTAAGKKKKAEKAATKQATAEKPTKKKKRVKKPRKNLATKAATNKVGERPTKEMLAKKAAKKTSTKRTSTRKVGERPTKERSEKTSTSGTVADRPKKAATTTSAKKSTSSKVADRPTKRGAKKTSKKVAKKTTRTRFVKTATKKTTVKRRGR